MGKGREGSVSRRWSPFIIRFIQTFNGRWRGMLFKFQRSTVPLFPLHSFALSPSLLYSLPSSPLTLSPLLSPSSPPPLSPSSQIVTRRRPLNPEIAFRSSLLPRRRRAFLCRRCCFAVSCSLDRPGREPTTHGFPRPVSTQFAFLGFSSIEGSFCEKTLDEERWMCSPDFGELWASDV